MQYSIQCKLFVQMKPQKFQLHVIKPTKLSDLLRFNDITTRAASCFHSMRFFNILCGVTCLRFRLVCLSVNYHWILLYKPSQITFHNPVCPNIFVNIIYLKVFKCNFFKYFKSKISNAFVSAEKYY